jgi:hypothetical protein
MGGGVTGSVAALAAYHDLLVAGGRFDRAGGIPVQSIASWDGVAWAPLDSGTDGYIFCLLDTPLGLVTGGIFDAMDGVPAANIALRDAAGWHPLGLGMAGNDAMVLSLAWHDGALVAGGHFDQAGGIPAANIACWDGQVWNPIGDGISSSVSVGVRALASFRGDLYAGGSFWRMFGAPGDGILRWDGISWSEVGGGASDVVEMLLPYGGSLVAGGVFRYMGGIEVRQIASWSGSAWAPLGSGVHWPQCDVACVHALAECAGDLFAGGDFRRTGNVHAYYLGRWVEPASHVRKPEAEVSLRIIVPNPLRPGAALLMTGRPAERVRIDLLDASGRLVRTLRHDYESGTIWWDGRDARRRLLSPGRYYLRAAGRESRSVRPIVVMP